MESNFKSLGSRAFIAFLLFIGFYGLAFTIVSILLYVAVYLVFHSKLFSAQLFFFCLIGAGYIIWSIMPRYVKFHAPGIKLSPVKHKQLFEVIYEVAKSTRQPMPDEVYIVHGVTASVGLRGGILGHFGRKTMNIGIQLLQVLTVQEFKAVIAHEFGHYYSGDLKFGPFVYRTRGAIDRTIRNLEKHSEFIQKIFIWYGRHFLKYTTSISRAQELTADKIASNVVSSEALGSALFKIVGGSKAFENYWDCHIVPIVNAGLYPPILSGFQNYLENESVNKDMEIVVQSCIEEDKVTIFSTHPTIKTRLEHLGLPTWKTIEVLNEPRAINLISDVNVLCDELLEYLFKEISTFEKIGWEEIGEKFFFPNWILLVTGYADILKGITTSNLPDYVDKFGGEFGRRLYKIQYSLSFDQRIKLTESILGAAIAMALQKKGWSLETGPGQPITFENNGLKIQPFKLLSSLITEKLDGAAWKAYVEENRIAEMKLDEKFVSSRCVR